MAARAITSPHPLASQAGMAVLDRGGSAIEAVIAAGSVLAVVTPHFCGLGGDAVWMVADAQGKAHGLLAIGQGISAPFPEQPIPLRGAGSIMTTAAVVDGWAHALDYARDHWGQGGDLAALLAPAITLAEEGYEVSESQKFWGEFRAPDLMDWPNFAAIFCPEGRPAKAGHLLRQPDLARSLHRIASAGARDFYEGALAGQILAGLQAQGVRISASDLAATRTRTVAPLQLDYCGYQLLAPPPPTQGMTTLGIMGILRHLDLAAHEAGGTQHLHRVVEAVKQAFLDRSAIADPAAMTLSPKDLLADAHLARKAGGIDPNLALDWPHSYRTGDTVFLAAADAQGNVASVLQSTYFDWGSGVVAGDTGILWQNRGAAFSHDKTAPNAFATGKLPFYTLNPGLALQDGRPVLAYGTQGADGQPQTLAMVLSRLIDYGQSAPEALKAPRFLLGKTFSDSRDSLKLEGDVPEPTCQELRQMGHQVAMIASQSPLAGLARVIDLREGREAAAHDPRGEGCGMIRS